MKVNKRRKSIVRMDEDAGYQHPLPFPQCFKRPISLRQGYIAYMYISKLSKRIRPKTKYET